MHELIFIHEQFVDKKSQYSSKVVLYFNQLRLSTYFRNDRKFVRPSASLKSISRTAILEITIKSLFCLQVTNICVIPQENEINGKSDINSNKNLSNLNAIL